MSCGNEEDRLVMKILTETGVVPTIPTSDSHKNGDWTYTDLYPGEWCVNETDGRIFNRTTGGIVEAKIIPLGTTTYNAIISQSSNNAPTKDYEDNKLGATASYNYVGVGEYTLTATGAFPDEDKVEIRVGSGRALSHQIIAYWTDANTITIKTGTPTSAEGVLSHTSIEIIVHP